MDWYWVATMLVILWVAFTTVIVLGMTRATRRLPVHKAEADRRKVTDRAVVA